MSMFPLGKLCRTVSTFTPRSLNWAGRQCAQNKTVTLMILCLVHLLGSSGVEAGAGNNIEQTPSWKIGLFFAFFLVLSVMLEIGLEVLEEYLEHHHLDGVKMTVEKIKEELMLMGFISLCLLIVEDYLVEWCIDNEGSDIGIPARMTTIDANGIEQWVCGMYNCLNSTQCYDEFGVEEVDYSDLQGLQPSGPQNPVCDCYKSYSSGYSKAAKNGSRLLGAAGSSTGSCKLKTSSGSYSKSNSSSSSSSSRMLLGGAYYACEGCNEVYFIDLKALHEAHTLIFVIACIHITYSCLVMFISSNKMEAWLKWEDVGRDSQGVVKDKESVEKMMKDLKMPTDHHGHVKTFAFACGEQFYVGVDIFTFIALRKFYIAKHDLHHNFEFHSFLAKGIQHDFSEMLGIRWWMYLLLVAQVTLEGYGIGQVGAFNWVALFIVLSAGAKLQSICAELALAIHHHYDKDGDGQIDLEELQELQAASDDHLTGIEPRFWFNKPELLLTMIQYGMWQNSQTLSIALYYTLHIGANSCYMQNRSVPMLIIQCIIAVSGLFLNALITVPMYSLVTHMGSHQGKMELLNMHRVQETLKDSGGNLAGAMKGMGAAQKKMLARMQADGTFAGGHTETLTSAIGRMAEKSEALMKAQEKTMKLIDMAAEMTSVDEIERLFAVVCHDAKDLCNADRATLFLVDDATDEVWSIVAEGIPPIRFNKSIGIIGATVTGPSLLNIPDAYADDRFNRSMDQKTGYKTNNILCVPIIHNKKKTCIGAMQILNKTDGEAGKGESTSFDDADIKIMMSFCKVVANSVVLLMAEKESIASETNSVNEQASEVESKIQPQKLGKKPKSSQVAPDPDSMP